MKLIIGNKNYSSWSLRAWLLMRHAGLEFEEIRIPLNTESTAQMLAAWCPAGKVPVLHDGPLVLWDSLAICEYIADKVPEQALWPSAPDTRARARAMSAEMHSGFTALRSTMPMNVRRQVHGFTPDLDTRIDINRVVQLFEDALDHSKGPWLFGDDYSVADAMYAPVLSRFHTYGIKLPTACRSYQQQVLSDEHYQAWLQDAVRETEVIEIEEIPDADAPMPGN